MYPSLIPLAVALQLGTPATPPAHISGAPVGAVGHPVADYDVAVLRVQLRQAEDDSVVATGARSIFLGHGQKTPRVFVLLHGFTDAPKQFEVLGNRFFSGGDNVYIPRLPHHAEREGKVRALGRVTAAELAAFGDSTVDIARGLGDTVIVVGLSAGANIAASVAQRRSDVYRTVLIAPAIAAGRVSEDVARGLVLIGSRMPNITRSDAPDSTRPDFIQGISTRGLAQVLRLGESVLADAERTPAAARQISFLLNQNDHTVNDDAAIDLARRWTVGAPLVSVFQFPASLKLPHNVMEATDRGGNLDVVLPVVEAIAMGSRIPESVRYQFIMSNWNRPRDPWQSPN
jgi:esterase/lipase